MIRGLLISGLLTATLWGQAVHFTKEYLVFTLCDSSLTFSGEYVFENPGRGVEPKRLLYPFSVSPDTPLPHRVKVSESASGESIPYTWVRNGISFLIEALPGESTRIHIRYWQAAPKRKNTYILTSTTSWGRGLDHATYEIRVPNHLELLNCSLAIDSVAVTDSMRTYLITRSDFLPEKELEINWGIHHEQSDPHQHPSGPGH